MWYVGKPYIPAFIWHIQCRHLSFSMQKISFSKKKRCPPQNADCKTAWIWASCTGYQDQDVLCMWEDVRCALFLLGRTQNSSCFKVLDFKSPLSGTPHYILLPNNFGCMLHAAYALVSCAACDGRPNPTPVLIVIFELNFLHRHHFHASPTQTQALEMADGSKYLGAWHDGKMHGQGELTSGDGVTHYKGAYRDGLMHGFGKLKNKLGEYEGEFVDSKMHGKGKSHTFDSLALLNPLAPLRSFRPRCRELAHRTRMGSCARRAFNHVCSFLICLSRILSGEQLCAIATV